METKPAQIPCATCKMRARYDTNPKSLIARFWHWHTRFCPGWATYMGSLTDEERQKLIEKYNLKKIYKIR